MAGVFFVFLSVLPIALHSSSARGSTSSGDLFPSLLLGCSEASAEWKVKVQAKVILNQRFLPASGTPDREAAIRDAIELQIKSVIGYFQNDADLKKRGKFALSAYREQFEILSQRATTYPFSLTIDRYRHPEQPGRPTYVTKALAAGSTSPQDEATEIQYTTTLRIALCPNRSDPDFLPKSTLLPPDPYLAFWYAAPTQRRPLKYRYTFSLISPCASPEMVEFGDSSQFWYLWNPNAQGKDNEGHLYDCKSTHPTAVFTTQMGLQYLAKSPRLPSVDNLAWKLKDSKTIHATVFFGNLATHEPNQLDIPSAVAKLPVLLKESPDSEIQRIKPFMIERQGRWLMPEAGAKEWLFFLSRLNKITKNLNMDLKAVEKTSRSLIITILGTFKLSGRPFVLRVYYGPTATHDQPGPEYWRLIMNSLKSDDLMIYNGHASLGENLSLATISQKIGINQKQLSLAMNNKKYQMISLFTCNAYSHFGEDILDKRKASETDLILSAAKDAGNMYVLELLRSIDRGLKGETVELGAAFSTFLPPDINSFMILRRAPQSAK